MNKQLDLFPVLLSEYRQRWRPRPRTERETKWQAQGIKWQGKPFTIEVYYLFESGQGNRCAICRTADKGKNAFWCVDHNHRSGEARGLLCGKCNVAVGLLGDNLDGVAPAVSYLLGTPKEAVFDVLSGLARTVVACLT